MLEFTKECRINNKTYKKWDQVWDRDIPFFPSVMKKVENEEEKTEVEAEEKVDGNVDPYEAYSKKHIKEVLSRNGVAYNEIDNKVTLIEKLNSAIKEEQEQWTYEESKRAITQ